MPEPLCQLRTAELDLRTPSPEFLVARAPRPAIPSGCALLLNGLCVAPKWRGRDQSRGGRQQDNRQKKHCLDSVQKVEDHDDIVRVIKIVVEEVALKGVPPATRALHATTSQNQPATKNLETIPVQSTAGPTASFLCERAESAAATKLLWNQLQRISQKKHPQPP